jgi:tetratricopeptide (TPR) repeat protein
MEIEGRLAREWYWRSAQYYGEAVRERPFHAHALRERALALDWSERPEAALPAHLRAIARDPDHARAYEYLGLHYWRQGRLDEAERLFRLAQRFSGWGLAHEYLPKIEEARRRSPAP